MTDPTNWERIQELARRVLKEGHPDRDEQQSWADELAKAVVFALPPARPVERDPDVTWPIINNLIHTRGSKTEVAVHRLGSTTAALVLRFGGASDATIHVQHMEEIIDIHRQLGFALDALEKETR